MTGLARYGLPGFFKPGDERNDRGLTANLLERTATWLPVIVIVAVVVVWFQNGNSQFPGDFFVPSNPVRYIQRFSQIWDPNLDFGLFSLFTLFPTPRLFLVAFLSAAFIFTGSPVAVEFFLVLGTLLLAYFGMKYLWGAIEGTGALTLGQSVASLFFVFNPYVMVYIPNPVGIIAYGMLPWCLGFALNGLRSGKWLKYSLLAGIAYTVSLITFPQVAISIIIAASVVTLFAFEFLKRPTLRIKQLSFMSSSILIVMGLNAYWLLLAFSRLSLVFALSTRVQANSPSLNAENSIFATPRLLGDWSFLAGYAGRLYLPYSADYSSSILTLVATSAIPVFALGGALLAPSRNRIIPIAGLAVVGIFLSKGINPPLGIIYGALLSIPGFALFRNPPRYFLSLVAVGYAIMLGYFVNPLSWKDRLGGPRRNLAKLGIILLVLLTISLASQPMISGEITRNWYAPSMKGYQIPNYYYDASNYLSQKDPTSRVFVLPQSGIYMATLWGYQGANIYPYIFSNPIVSGSGGQYSLSASSSLIASVYREFYANRTTSLGKVLSLLGSSYVLFDGSVDTQFYSLPTAQSTLSLLDKQSDLRQAAVFGDLILFKNTESVAIVSSSSRINILDASPSSPSSIVLIDGFQTDWQLGPSLPTGASSTNGTMHFGSSQLTTNLPANGQYVFAELYKSLSLISGTKYLILYANTLSPTSVAVTVDTLDGEVPLQAQNPPQQSLLNHYQLDHQSYLVYRLDGVKSNVTQIRIAVSNRLSTGYSGILEANFSKLILANQVGDLSDLSDTVQQASFDPNRDAVTFSSFLEPAMMKSLVQLNSSTKPPPVMEIKKLDPTDVVIHVKAQYPFVLTYFTSFDESFEAKADGNLPAYHFRVDGLANGWYFPQTGEFTIRITYGLQRVFLLGIGVTSATIGSIIGILLMSPGYRVRTRSLLSRRWRRNPSG